MSRRKTWLFRLVLLFAAWLFIEAAALVLLSTVHSGWSKVFQDLQEAAAADPLGKPKGEHDEVYHPYVGFVRKPTEATKQQGRGLGVTDFGYLDEGLPLRVRQPDQVIVAVVGGSVAEQFITRSSAALERELRKSPFFRGKKVVFVRLALSGYKQPQQFLTLSYLLSLGGEFDLLINLDGYNEVVLPVLENEPSGVFPAFPRVWQARRVETHDQAALRLVGRVVYLREQARSRALFVNRPPWNWSPTVCLLWVSSHRALENSINEDLLAFTNEKASQREFAVSGPRLTFASEPDGLRYCAALWRRSSWQMHQLCAANGIRYYHFLQPNQYLPGSKPQLSDAERRLAVQPGALGEAQVHAGYPLLIQQGAELSKRGVRFGDLTQIFASHPEPTYSDACCHLTDRGNDILAQRIGEFVRRDLDPPVE